MYKKLDIMAENKKSFIAYSDWKDTFDALPDDKAGLLIKHIFDYVNDEDPITEDILVNAVFQNIKNALKRDLSKWDKQYNQRVLAGKKSAEVRKRNATAVNERSISSTVSVNGNVSVNDNVNDIIINKEKPKKVYSSDVLNCYESLINFFPEQLHPEKKETWYSEIEKLNRIDKIPFEIIIGIVQKTRQDAFWGKNFLSLTKLRKKNKDGLKYIVVFNEKFNSVPQQEQKVGRQTLSTIEQNTKGWD